MALSNGEKQMLFDTHDEALNALDEEIKSTALPSARNVVDMSESYRIAQLEVRHEGTPGALFAVSDRYLRLFFGENAVPMIKFMGKWYKNVQGKYEQKEDGEQMPSLFFSQSSEYECMNYYDNIIFHTPRGFVSADRNDLSNNVKV